MSVTESMSALRNLTFSITEGVQFSRTSSANKSTESLFMTLCTIIITICIVVHLLILLWVLYMGWKLMRQRSGTTKDNNIEKDFESSNMETNGADNIEGSSSVAEKLLIIVNHTMAVYKLQTSTTVLLPFRQ